MAVRIQIRNTDTDYEIQHFAVGPDHPQVKKYNQPHTLVLHRFEEHESNSVERAIVLWLSDDDVAELIQSFLGMDVED